MENLTTANQVELTVQAYINEEREPMENLIRHAFLAGYSAALKAAKAIYNPEPTARTSN